MLKQSENTNCAGCLQNGISNEKGPPFGGPFSFAIDENRVAINFAIKSASKNVQECQNLHIGHIGATMCFAKKNVQFPLKYKENWTFSGGPSDGIRTHGLLDPNHKNFVDKYVGFVDCTQGCNHSLVSSGAKNASNFCRDSVSFCARR